VDQLIALATHENIVIAALAIMLIIALTGNVVQYRDYRRDREKPWAYVSSLTATLKKLELTMVVLMERVK
jgi:hypothetical protein